MLRDALMDLMKKNAGGDMCKLGKVIRGLDEDTSGVLVDALRSDIATTVICRTLNNEGIKISREFLGTQRKQCFLSSNNPERCCLAEKKETQGGKNE